MRFKTITISGLGGVGGYYGAMLLQAAAQEGQGRQIHFVARGAHRAAIAERGLHIHTPERDFTVHPDALAEDPRELPVTDLLILATQSYDLAANVEQLPSGSASSSATHSPSAAPRRPSCWSCWSR